MPTTTIHVLDLESAGQIYQRVFELTPIHGPAKFNEAGWSWSEWETPLPDEETLFIRLVQHSNDPDAFPADDFGRLVVKDLHETLARASNEGFVVVSPIEEIHAGHMIFRARDPDKNRILVSNASLWVRRQEATS